MPDEVLRDSAAAQDVGIAVVLAGVGLMTSVAFGMISPEGIFHFDDLTHYLYAKWAWTWPAYLADSWGRPGFTVLYFLPAGLGWWACRILSALLTAVSALLAFSVARRMKLRHSWVVVLLAYAQPLFFQLSQTTLTETALAFYLILALFLAQRRRWSLSAAVLSLGLVTRHEAAVFVPIWAWFAWRDEQANAAGPSSGGSPNIWERTFHAGCALLPLWPVLWAPLVVNVTCWLSGLGTPLSHLLEPKPSEVYGRGGWLTFCSRSLEAWGPGVAVLAMLGLHGTWHASRHGHSSADTGVGRYGAVDQNRDREGAAGGRRAVRAGPIVTSCIVVYFAAQTVIRALGLYDSGGYARFLVPISPLVAIAALVGWHRLWVREPRRQRLAAIYAAGFMVLLLLAMNRQVALYKAQQEQIANVPHVKEAVEAVRFATGGLLILAATSCTLSVAGERLANKRGLAIARALVPAGLVTMILLADYALCYPLKRPVAAQMAADLFTRLAEDGLAGREIISAHVWVDYVAGNELPLPRASVGRRLERAPIGAIFVWDSQFAPWEPGLRLQDVGTSRALRRIHTAEPIPPGRFPYFITFEKIGPWPSP